MSTNILAGSHANSSDGLDRYRRPNDEMHATGWDHPPPFGVRVVRIPAIECHGRLALQIDAAGHNRKGSPAAW